MSEPSQDPEAVRRQAAPAPRYVVDPDDPRAPSAEIWELLTPEERAEVVESLPSEFPLD